MCHKNTEEFNCYFFTQGVSCHSTQNCVIMCQHFVKMNYLYGGNAKAGFVVVRVSIGAGLDLQGPYYFCSDDFRPKWSHFSLPEHTPKLTKLGIYVTPAEKFQNVLASSISTTRWCYNQGKCILFSKTLYPRIHWIVLNLVIGHAHFRFPFFSANSRNIANLLFWTPLTDLHQTLHKASMDSPDKMFWKEFWYSKQYSRY